MPIFSPLPAFQTLVSGLAKKDASEAATRWASEQLEIDEDPLDMSGVHAMFGLGVSNPHGPGASAFEPNTISLAPELKSPSVNGIFDSYATEYERRKAERDAALLEAQSKNDMSNPSGVVHQVVGTAANRGGPMAGGTGLVANIISAAKSMLGTWYVWGGSTASGVDCSGLIYYAFNKAGFSLPRYRAVDYGTRVGHAVSLGEARPGDLVYFDNPGDVDHVGIYLGGNQFIEAPQTGEKVKISSLSGRNPTSIRRILPESAWR